ncbi:MAG: plasmid mobilization relaxosome protein MobC [Rikenellaceae bacterium]
MKQIKNRNNNGRPKVATMEKKSYRVTVKLSPPEYYALRGKASKAGCNMSEMIRQSIENCTVKERLCKEHTNHILHLTAMGNNLNQLAKKANQAGMFGLQSECERLLNGIDEGIKFIANDR